MLVQAKFRRRGRLRSMIIKGLGFAAGSGCATWVCYARILPRHASVALRRWWSYLLAYAAGQRSRSLTFSGSPRLAVRSSGWHVEEGERLAGGKTLTTKDTKEHKEQDCQNRRNSTPASQNRAYWGAPGLPKVKIENHFNHKGTRVRLAIGSFRAGCGTQRMTLAAEWSKISNFGGENW